MKFKTIITLVLLVFICNIGIYSAQAQSPTATDAGTIRDSVKQKVADELSQIKNAVAKKAFVGNVTAKSDATITINTLLGDTRTAIVSTDTTIKLANGKDGTPTDITVGVYVIAMGDVNSQNVMTVKRLLTIPKPIADKRQAFFGLVTTATSSTLTISPATNAPQTIKLTSATKYAGKTKATDIKTGSKIVVIGNPSTDSSTLTALRLHLFTP